MRIAVIGTSGAGKTMLSLRIAGRLGVPHIELDAINWQPGWRDLTRHDPEEFIRRVTKAIQAEAWVADGNYGARPNLAARNAFGLARLRTPSDYGPSDPPFTASSHPAHRDVGRQSRAMAAPAAAESPDPMGVEHLGPAPTRDGREIGATGICTSCGAAAATPERDRQGGRVLGGGRPPDFEVSHYPPDGRVASAAMQWHTLSCRQLGWRVCTA
jgi:hypothetical protein